MRVITSTEELAQVCERLERHPYVAVDTEFMRETTFFPKLCLIQMAGPGDEVVVDPLAPGLDLAPFYRLMANEAVEKVFHAARQDVEIVYIQAKVLPKPLFDTQIAAMVCGFGESVSYVNLVKKLTGVDLDKTHRFTDWARRPLSPQQLTYALGDVTHLREVYVRLRDQLESSGRASWLEEEVGELLDPHTYESPPDEAWRRLKLRVRNRKSLAVLVELAAWREQMAQLTDVPRGRVLRDEALYDIANLMPTDPGKLSELRSLSDGFGRSTRGKEIIEVVKRGLARDPKTLPAIPNGSSIRPEDSATAELLKVLLKAVSARHGVAPRLVATSEEIEKLVSEVDPDVPAMRGWRRELFGEAALRLKTGKVSLAIRNGEVVTVEDGGETG